MSLSGEKYIKKRVFTKSEKELLCKLVNKYKVTLNSKHSSVQIALKKKKCWEKIAKEFNTSTVCFQYTTNRQLMELWNDMRSEGKPLRTNKSTSTECRTSPVASEQFPLNVYYSNVGIPDFEDISNNKRDYMVNGWMEGHSVECNCSRSNKSNRMNPFEEVKIKILEEELDFKRKIQNEEFNLRRMEQDFKQRNLEIEHELKLKQLNEINMEELEFNRKIHDEELKLKQIEREYKERFLALEYKIRLKQLENEDCL